MLCLVFANFLMGGTPAQPKHVNLEIVHFPKSKLTFRYCNTVRYSVLFIRYRSPIASSTSLIWPWLYVRKHAYLASVHPLRVYARYQKDPLILKCPLFSFRYVYCACAYAATRLCTGSRSFQRSQCRFGDFQWPIRRSQCRLIDFSTTV